MPRPYLGVQYFAIQHKRFPVVKALKVFQGVDLSALSFLWGTFGMNHDGWIQFLNNHRDRPHLLMPHMGNGSCQRKGICKRGELTRKSKDKYNRALIRRRPLVLRAIRKRAIIIRDTIEPHMNQNTEVILGAFLEDNFGSLEASIYIDEIKKVWPYQISRNPVGTGTRGGADYLELHGTNRFLAGRKNIGGLDGTDIVFPHRSATIPNKVSVQRVAQWLRENKSNSKAMFLWSALHQGIQGDSSSSPSPRRRTPRVPVKDVNVMRHLLKEGQ